MIATMPKKTVAKLDRRATRFEPLLQEEIRDAAKRLGEFVGVLLESANEMASFDMSSIKFDGKQKFFDAVDVIIETTKTVKGKVEGEKVGRRSIS